MAKKKKPKKRARRRVVRKRKPRPRPEPKDGTKRFRLKKSIVAKVGGFPIRLPKGTVFYTHPANIKLMDVLV